MCTELDLGYESCNVDGGCSLRTGTGFYDGYLVKTGWLAEFVSAAVLKPLNDYLRESTAFAWNDVMPPVRRYLSTFDGNVVMTPVDADFGTAGLDIPRKRRLFRDAKACQKDVNTITKRHTEHNLRRARRRDAPSPCSGKERQRQT